MGRGGPKAAGRAGKEVLLSSVRLMTAFGGKSVRGEVKEKRFDRREEDRVKWLVNTVARARAVRVRKRKKEEAAKQRTSRATLGGRILSTQPT